MTVDPNSAPPRDGDAAGLMPPDPLPPAGRETPVLLNWIVMILGLGAVAALGALLPKLM